MYALRTSTVAFSGAHWTKSEKPPPLSSLRITIAVPTTNVRRTFHQGHLNAGGKGRSLCSPSFLRARQSVNHSTLYIHTQTHTPKCPHPRCPARWLTLATNLLTDRCVRRNCGERPKLRPFLQNADPELPSLLFFLSKDYHLLACGILPRVHVGGCPCGLRCLEGLD